MSDAEKGQRRPLLPPGFLGGKPGGGLEGFGGLPTDEWGLFLPDRIVSVRGGGGGLE